MELTDCLEASLSVTEVDAVDSPEPLLEVSGDGERSPGGLGGGGALKSMSNIALGGGGSGPWSGDQADNIDTRTVVLALTLQRMVRPDLAREYLYLGAEMMKRRPKTPSEAGCILQVHPSPVERCAWVLL